MKTQQKQKHQKEQQKLQQECKKYRLDIVDYATSERSFLTPDKKKELIQHLKECQICQDAFLDYEDIYATAVTEEHFAQPETKKRYAELLEKIKTKPTRASTELSRTSSASAPVKVIQGKPVLNNETEIGTPAGAVWRYLAKNGWVKVNDLTKNLRRTDKIDPDETKFAVGWLACQNKIYQTRVKQTKYVYLTEPEREIYQQEQAGV